MATRRRRRKNKGKHGFKALRPASTTKTRSSDTGSSADTSSTPTATSDTSS